MSLLECTSAKSSELQKIVRAIPMQILVKNLTSIYRIFKEKEKLNYTMQLFETYSEAIDFNSEETEKYEMIIENAFNSFILVNIFKDYHQGQKQSLADEVDQELNEFLVSLDNLEGQSSNTNFKLISDFSNLGKSMFKLGFSLLKMMKGATFDLAKNAIFSQENKSDEKLNQEKEESEKQSQKEALKFFHSRVQHIEIIRDEQIYRIYFPALPLFQKLDKKLKRDFHENVDRSTTVSKIQGLIKSSSYLLLAMKHEERLRLLLKRFSILQIIASQKVIWENLSFLCCILLNLIILFSYNTNQVPSEAYNEDGKLVDKDMFEDYKLNHPQLDIFSWQPSFT